jgi:hypothetical protein
LKENTIVIFYFVEHVHKENLDRSGFVISLLEDLVKVAETPVRRLERPQKERAQQDAGRES